MSEQEISSDTQAENFTTILYSRHEGVGVITLNRPRYRNAQNGHMLDEIDAAFELASADDDVRVVILRGSDGVFSAGHDLSSSEAKADTENLETISPLARYDAFRKYNLDLLLKWRNFPKPTIAMVEGYCIYAGWMLAAAMDIVVASENAKFLGGMLEFNTMPWDIGFRRAKELTFESRFISAETAREYGFVNRVVPSETVWEETLAFASRIAENDPYILRMSKIQINKAQDACGFSQNMEDSFSDWMAMCYTPGMRMTAEDGKKLTGVALALSRVER